MEKSSRAYPYRGDCTTRSEFWPPVSAALAGSARGFFQPWGPGRPLSKSPWTRNVGQFWDLRLEGKFLLHKVTRCNKSSLWFILNSSVLCLALSKARFHLGTAEFLPRRRGPEEQALLMQDPKDLYLYLPTPILCKISRVIK